MLVLQGLKVLDLTGRNKVCSVDGKIYLVAGLDTIEVMEFDPRTSSWRFLSSIGKWIVNYKVCVLDKKIFVVNGAADHIEILDIDNGWRKVGQIGRRGDHLSGACVASVGGRIYIIGGSHNTNYVYDFQKGKLAIQQYFCGG